jgi:signal transduction histidine kinase
MMVDYFSRLDPGEQKEYLKSIDSATERLAKLVNNLLESSRMEAGLLKLEKSPTLISRIIREAADEARIRDERHRIVTRLEKGLPKINIDAKRIRQVLDNLIDNAVKYSPVDTKVQISARFDGSGLTVSVADEGPGISGPELSRVFDRMYRIEQRLSSGADGIGLGLYICRRFIDVHGGKIWVESEGNKGSIFYFTLPVSRKGKKIKALRKDMNLRLFP